MSSPNLYIIFRRVSRRSPAYCAPHSFFLEHAQKERTRRARCKKEKGAWQKGHHKVSSQVAAGLLLACKLRFGVRCRYGVQILLCASPRQAARCREILPVGGGVPTALHFSNSEPPGRACRGRRPQQLEDMLSASRGSERAACFVRSSG